MLKLLQDVCDPTSESSIGALPTFSIGGWDGWQQAVGAAKSMRNALGDKIIPYCIFDRDYRSMDDCNDRLKLAIEAGIRVHVWSRKEIENYFLSVPGITKSIADRAGVAVAEADVAAELDRQCEAIKQETIEAYADAYQQRNRGKSVSSAMQHAQAVVNEQWTTTEGKLGCVSGKRLLSLMSQWAQDRYHVMLNPANISRHLLPLDLPEEMRKVIQAIERGLPFR